LLNLRQEIQNSIKYPSGYVFDLKGLFLRKDILQELSDIFWKTYESKLPFQIGALELTSIPLLSVLIMTAPQDVNGFIVRKERKSGGMGNIIEGSLNEHPIILIDDIYNSGKSINHAVAAMQREVSDIFVLIDFENNPNPKVTSLFKKSEFMVKYNPPPNLVPKFDQFKKVWDIKIDGGLIVHTVPKCAPLLVDEILYYGCDNGSMNAIDKNDGQLLWSHKKNSKIWSSPACHEDIIYYGDYSGRFYALDRFTGKEIWSQQYCDWIGSSPSILADKNMLLIGMEYSGKVKGSVTALSLDKGEIIWSHFLREFQHGSGVMTDEMSVWGTNSNKVVALDHSGKKLWEFVGGEKILSRPSLRNNLISFCGSDEFIYLLDINGNLIKKWKTEGNCNSTPLLTETHLWCGSGDDHLYIINLETLEIERKINLKKKIFSSPVSLGGSAILGTNSGQVYEFDIKTFELLNNFCVGDSITNPIIHEGSKIYLSTVMNDLYCYQRTEMT
jgi:outer membrane protein assembly factor BamB/orotate phosphoribosyltransferase